MKNRSATEQSHGPQQLAVGAQRSWPGMAQWAVTSPPGFPLWLRSGWSCCAQVQNALARPGAKHQERDHGQLLLDMNGSLGSSLAACWAIYIQLKHLGDANRKAGVQTLLSQPLQQLLSCNLESIDAGGDNQRPGLHSPEGLPVRH